MNFENIQAENIVVAYINGKAIAQNEWGAVFYLEIPEDFIEIGDVLPATDLTPLNELDEQEQLEIYAALHEMGVEV